MNLEFLTLESTFLSTWPQSVSCLASQVGDWVSLTNLVVRHLLDVDVGPVEDM